MEDAKHDGADDTDELLCTEVISDFVVFPPALPRDRCDLLLDAIDAQLSRLQTRSHSQANGEHRKPEDVLDSVPLDRSTSVSKDTGLGTDKASSAPEGLNTNHADVTTVEPSRSQSLLELEDEHEEQVRLGTVSWLMGGTGKSSKREECLWRLERLLGTGAGVTRTEEGDEEDSVRTEDFSTRFLDEMLEPTKMSSAGSASDVNAKDSASISSDTTILTEPQVTSMQNAHQNPRICSVKSPNRKLAGVPLKSFDLVTIDSDLDSVCTERVRQHLQSTLTNRIAQGEFLQNCEGRASVTTTHQHETYTVSSEDEVNSVCVRCYSVLRSSASVQRREKRNDSRRKSTSSSSRASTTAAAQRVERLSDEVQEAEKEQHTLQRNVTHTRTHNQLVRSEQHNLQDQKDSYFQEFRALQESQAALQSPITTVQDSPGTHTHVNSGCVSALEREEMDRLLENAKSELFSEQRRFRHMLDSMKERLEDVTQELEQKQEENRKLKENCSQLEGKLNTATKTRHKLQDCVRRERVEHQGQLGALEKIIAQKELLFLALQEEKKRLEMEIRAIREENSARLTAALAHAQKQKEVDVEQLRSQMTLTNAEELQRVRIQMHEIKEVALREQAVTHTRHTEALHNRIQMNEEEVKRLQESLKQQQEELRRREEELRGESQDQVKRALEREQRKWEEQRAESLKKQQVRMEKEMQEVERRGRAEVEREKRSAHAMQNKVLEMQKTVEELENAASKQTSVIRALRDEHQTELYKLRRQLQQEAESESMRLKECVKRCEQDLQAVRAELADSEHLQQVVAARHEQQYADWAQDIHTECACLQELLSHNGFTVDNTHLLSHSVTVREAVQVLKSLRKSLQQLITSLQNHIISLTHAKQQLSADKEEELRVQREKLTAEKERAVTALREKLIQEHIEELSNLNKVRLHEDDDNDCMAARLRRQLQAKDEELRQVQRNMMQWKEKTTAQLTHKFEQERWKVDWLRKRKFCRRKSEQRLRLEQLEGEMRHLTESSSEIMDIPPSSTSSAHIPDTGSSHDLDSYKLLRHLQSRIRQLQADTHNHIHAYTPGAVRVNREPRTTELTGSYLETIAPALDSHVTQQRSDLRTARTPNL